MTTPTISNTGRHENPTRRTTVKTEMIRWYRQQQQQMAEQLRRIHGRED